ncbi:MAG: zinc ribbon domain-containing protein [Acidobacteriales bacterium]|nr:zinc ribbon domain-containing protein [Terriglobales bacterium]
MVLSCHRCGQALSEQVAFCAQCGAPQIRFTMPEPEPNPELPAETFSEQPVRVPGISWTRGFFPCFVPAVVCVLVSSLGPLALLSPLFLLAAGFAAVRLYARRTERAPVTSAMGVRLGAVTGLLSFGLQTLMLGIAYLVALASGRNFVAETITDMREMMRSAGPDAARVFQQITATPSAFAAFLFLALLITLIISVVCGLLGGAVSAAWLKRQPGA